MTSPSDFMPLFSNCKSIQDTNKSYHQGIAMLQECHRLAMTKLVVARDEGVPKRIPLAQSETPLVTSEKALQKSHDTVVRQWATAAGVPFQRVSRQLRAMYAEAHSGE